MDGCISKFHVFTGSAKKKNQKSKVAIINFFSYAHANFAYQILLNHNNTRFKMNVYECKYNVKYTKNMARPTC